MEIDLSKHHNHLELHSLFEKCLKEELLSFDLMIKNKELTPGSLIAILQFLNSLDRYGLTHKVSLFKIDSTELKKSLSEYSLIYAWSLFINDRNRYYFPELYEVSAEYYQTLESILHFKKEDVLKVKEKRSSGQRIDPQFLTAHALGKEKKENQKQLSKSQENYYQKIFSNRTRSKKEGTAYFFHGCFDHIIGLGTSGFMYSDQSSKTIKSKESIRQFFRNIFDFYFLFNDQSGHNRRVISNHSIYDHLSVIFYELIHNTHIWATYKSSEKISNIRGSYLGIQKVKKWDQDSGSVIGHFIKNLKEYYGRQEKKLFYDDESKNPILLIELSIIDAGRGYPEVYLKRPLSEITIEEETNAIRDCFKRNMTSDTGNIAPLKGIGLAEVTKMLSLGKGLITIRTGRSFGFRDFIANPIDEEKELKGKEFWLDIESNLFPVSGTTVSIFYPIMLIG